MRVKCVREMPTGVARMGELVQANAPAMDPLRNFLRNIRRLALSNYHALRKGAAAGFYVD